MVALYFFCNCTQTWSEISLVNEASLVLLVCSRMKEPKGKLLKVPDIHLHIHRRQLGEGGRKLGEARRGQLGEARRGQQGEAKKGQLGEAKRKLHPLQRQLG